MSIPSRQEFEAQIVAKAWKDEAFKQALLNDPRAAIEQEFGQALPPDVTIKVVEETPTTLYLILPMNADTYGSEELTTAELDSVAGGVGSLASGTLTADNKGRPSTSNCVCSSTGNPYICLPST